MLYTFPKQPRFLKRKSRMYHHHHTGAIDSMISKTHSRNEEPDLAMVTSTISLRTCQAHLHPTITRSRMIWLIRKKGFRSDRAEMPWPPLDHLPTLSATKIQDLITTTSNKSENNSFTPCPRKSSSKIKKWKPYQDQVSTLQPSQSTNKEDISRLNIELAVSVISEKEWECHKVQLLSKEYQDLELMTYQVITISRPRENIVYRGQSTVWVTVLEVRIKEEMWCSIEPLRDLATIRLLVNSDTTAIKNLFLRIRRTRETPHLNDWLFLANH